jgi:hypothetical protein
MVSFNCSGCETPIACAKRCVDGAKKAVAASAARMEFFFIVM